MTQDDILAMFRQQSETMDYAGSRQNEIIFELAQLLADSRGRLSKENFEALVRIGALLYKEGQSRFHAQSDVDGIMKRSLKD